MPMPARLHLANWAPISKIQAAVQAADKLRGSIIAPKQLLGWAPPENGALLHDGFLEEFGSQHLGG